MSDGRLEPSLGMKLSPSSSVMSVVLPPGVRPSSCETNVRPVSWSVKRIGSPAARGVEARRSGFASQFGFAGEEQSLKGARYRSGENPPKSITRPPSGILNMLLEKLGSAFQLQPIAGPPPPPPRPPAAGQLWN